MINRDDVGKRIYTPISRDNLYSDACGRPMTLAMVGAYGCIATREDGVEVSRYAEDVRVLNEPKDGLQFKLFVWHHAPFNITLPRGAMARRVKALKDMFHPNCRIALVEGSTRNNIRLKFLSPRVNRDWPGWELVALNIGEDQGDAVHEETRKVRGAYPAKRQKATKAGRRDRAAKRGS